VDIIKGQHNPFVFLKVLMRKSSVCICNASPLLPWSSYHLLGLPDLSKTCCWVKTNMGEFTVQIAKQLTIKHSRPKSREGFYTNLLNFTNNSPGRGLQATVVVLFRLSFNMDAVLPK